MFWSFLLSLQERTSLSEMIHICQGPQSVSGCGICLYLKARIRDFKEKWGWDSGLKVCTWKRYYGFERKFWSARRDWRTLTNQLSFSVTQMQKKGSCLRRRDGTWALLWNWWNDPRSIDCLKVANRWILTAKSCGCTLMDRKWSILANWVLVTPRVYPLL